MTYTYKQIDKMLGGKWPNCHGFCWEAVGDFKTENRVTVVGLLLDLLFG